jgi:hypothetical protein
MNKSLIKQINEMQKNPEFHPLTCGNDSRHSPLVAEGRQGRIVLVCKDCDYVQEWIPDCYSEENEKTHCPGCGQYPEDCECDSED